jgi:phosphatidylglycerol:prolipoprotein diacylglycerol transferase
MIAHNLLAPLFTLSGLFYALGYVGGAAAFLAMARGRKLATQGVYTMFWVGLLGGLVGANLAQWIFGGSDGKSILGAIAVGYAAVWAYKRRIGLKRPLGDLFAVAVTVGEAIGRWGCYFGGCCYGKPWTGPWAVWQHGSWRHPTQIYSSLAAVLILCVLLLYARRKPPENSLFYLQGILYCVARFMIEFYRVTTVLAGGLSAAQWACIGGLVFFGTAYVRLQRSTEAAPGIAGALPKLS